MLKLLLKTRLLYYLNFIRAHFSRRLQIEIGLLALLGLYLLLRSPADIGYRLDGIFSGAYSPERLESRVGLLWLFYLLAEAAAYVTLRPTADRDLLAGLPVSQNTFFGYSLLRFLLKISPLLFVGTIPFLGSPRPLTFRLSVFALTNLVLLTPALLAFSQARQLRRRRFWRWLLMEVPLLVLLIFAPKPFRQMPEWGLLFWFAIALLVSGGIFWHTLHTFSPENIGSGTRRTGTLLTGHTLWRFTQSATLACSINDLYFLLRKKRSVFWMLGLETFVVSASVLSQKELAAALISIVFIQVLFSWLLVLNLLLVLFERDAKLQIFRNLPLNASQVWWARWLLVAFFCAAPLLLPLGIILAKFHLTLQFPLFAAGILLLVPSVLGTIFCNTGFTLFPQANLAGYLMNFSILLVVLFWFYMPFGSFFILGIMLFWIRKSQKHFQLAEI